MANSFALEQTRRKRKEWYASTQGRAALNEAKNLQNNLQVTARQKMSELREKTGTTGMDNAGYENFFGEMFDKNTHRGNPISTNSQRKTYRMNKRTGKMERIR